MSNHPRNSPREGFQAVSETEASALKTLWEQGALSPRELQAALKDKGRDWAYTTVQTLLHRLLAKGFVTRERRGSGQIYRTELSTEDVLLGHMDELAERLCDGQTSLLVQSLVKGHRFSPDDISHFRELLDEAEAEGRQSRKRESDT